MNNPSSTPPDAPLITGAEGRSLCRISQGKQQLEVRQWEQWRWIRLGNRPDIVQGLYHQKYPDLPVTAYCIGMLSALLLQPLARQVLNLGLGCGAFERYLLQHYPRIELTSVEQEIVVVDVARRFFDLPTNYPVVIDDAANFLDQCHGNYDLILCDLHDGNHQPAIHDEHFVSDLSLRLGATGVISMNLCDAGQNDVVTLLLNLRQKLPHTVLLKPPRSQNLVILASRQPLPAMSVLRGRADEICKHSGLALHHCLENWQPLQSRH